MTFSDLPSPPRDTQVCTHRHTGTHTPHHSATAGVVAFSAAPGSELMENALDAKGVHSGPPAEQELDAVVAAAAAAAGSAKFPFK